MTNSKTSNDASKKSGPQRPGGQRRTRRSTTGNTSPASRRPLNKRHVNSKSSHNERQGQRSQNDKIPSITPGTVRIIPLGGVEEVGKNMIVVESYDDIFVFDAGFQFVAEDEAPGIDYILPNVSYLIKHKKKIRGIFVTHGHLDHIGAIPYIMEMLDYPPIYAAEITELLIRKRNEEFPGLKKISYIPFKAGRRMKVGESYIRSFPVTHSIPDSIGFALETPKGDIVITGDLKLDHHKGVPSEKEEKMWGELGEHNNLMFICDSTNAEQLGFSTDEYSMLKNLEQLIKDAPHRVIVGTFASQFARMTSIIEISEKYGRNVVIEGRSMKVNVEIAKQVNRMNIKKGTLISAREASKLPEKKVLVLATGAQGEEFAALMRMATKQHKDIELNDRDTIILSSSVIPGNEVSVQKLKDNLTRHGLRFFSYRTTDIHTSGHGNIEELIWMNQKVNAKYFMPCYGYHSMLRSHAQSVIDKGRDAKSVIIPDNGNVIEIDSSGEMKVLKEKVANNILAVGGFRVGEIQDVVIRDRKTLTKDGIFVVVITLDLQSGEIKKSLDIISRGFIYLRDNQELMQGARKVIKDAVLKYSKGAHPISFDEIKSAVSDEAAKFLVNKTGKRPIIIPVILGM